MRTPTLLLTALSLALAAGPAFAQSAGVETRAPNGKGQTPAFENQTRAPQPAKAVEIKAEVIAKGLPHLWAMEFLPDGRMLVTAKDGGIYIVDPKGGTREVEGVPEVASAGQGGLLDVALAPDFEQSRLIYFSFSEPRDDGNGTSVASARLVEGEDGASLEETKVIFRQMPSYSNSKHFGSRLAFGPDNLLYVTVGERSDRKTRVHAQDLSSGFGKVFRIDASGKAPVDNPFVGKEDAQPEIWSYGHRNMQAAAIDGKGQLWTVEHGPKGGDELNRAEAGKNYGWPVITYGIDYNGKPIGDGITAADGMEQPVYYWDPVIGPSGMAFYDGDAIPEWKGAILIGGLVAQGVVVLHMEGDRVTFEEHVPLDARVRDVKVGPDGAVYAVTEGDDSSTIVRLSRS